MCRAAGAGPAVLRSRLLAMARDCLAARLLELYLTWFCRLSALDSVRLALAPALFSPLPTSKCVGLGPVARLGCPAGVIALQCAVAAGSLAVSRARLPNWPPQVRWNLTEPSSGHVPEPGAALCRC